MPLWRVPSAADPCACRQFKWFKWMFEFVWFLKLLLRRFFSCYFKLITEVNGWKGRSMLEGQLDRKGSIASITGVDQVQRSRLGLRCIDVSCSQGITFWEVNSMVNGVLIILWPQQITGRKLWHLRFKSLQKSTKLGTDIADHGRFLVVFGCQWDQWHLVSFTAGWCGVGEIDWTQDDRRTTLGTLVKSRISMEGVMFQLGCLKIWSRHANCGWKSWNLCSFASMKRHTLTTLSGILACREVSKCTQGRRLTAQGLKNKGKPMCPLDAAMWWGGSEKVSRFQLRFKQTCSEQQEEHGGRRGAWMQLGHSQDSWWLVKRLHDP